ncbi:MAG: hypothetical protein ACD_46C00633G0005 [uncultured bacterium]|nr:MAG: hypothetical protein ACD_46C00633G0005 [uncultured bacterium]
MHSSDKNTNQLGILEIKEPVKKSMDEAGIPWVSIASLDKDGKIKAGVHSSEVAANDMENQLTPETTFGAASLSKPVFAYLVLKLIEDNKTGKVKKDELGEFKLPSSKKFDLDTPLHEVFPDIIKEFPAQDKDKAEKLTARMVLAHTTGLPITHDSRNGPIPFQFEPGTQYGYSGPGIACLQKVIEEITDSKLELLSQKYIFGKDAFDMPNSGFDKNKSVPSSGANSLRTTATDYIKFIQGWLNDPALQDAFKPGQDDLTMKKSFLPEDWGIKDIKGKNTIDDIDRNHVSWGLGLGLQLDDKNKNEVVSAYHSGDMGEYRAWVAINVKEKSAIVFFSNSHNGHILAEKIIPPEIKLDHVYNFFFKTYGFARNENELVKEAGNLTKEEKIEHDCGLRNGSLTGIVQTLSSNISSTTKIQDTLSSQVLQSDSKSNLQSSVSPTHSSKATSTSPTTLNITANVIKPEVSSDNEKKRKSPTPFETRLTKK